MHTYLCPNVEILNYQILNILTNIYFVTYIPRYCALYSARRSGIINIGAVSYCIAITTK